MVKNCISHTANQNNMNSWKKLFLKYFDINTNKKVDLWEIILLISFVILFQLVIQIGGSYIYDTTFNPHYEKNQSNTAVQK